MASTIDSGIETGNESNDSSLPEILSKLDIETLQTTASESNKEATDTLSEKYQIAFHRAIPAELEQVKLKDSSKPTTIIPSPSASSYQCSPLPESCARSFNCALLNAKSSNEVGDLFFGQYGGEYAARDLVTKRHPKRLRFKCLLRSPCDSKLNYFLIREHLKLVRAVSHNNTDTAKELLIAGVTPNCCDTFRRTPLHLAASMGYSDMVKLLLDYGANPNTKDSKGNTPLHLAACTNHVRVISLLMEAGTRLREKDLAGHSPLELAITKLNIMKRAVSPNLALQEQITQVVQMMRDYMKREEHVEPALLNRLFSVMQVKDLSEDVESNIQDLLSKLSISNKS